MRSARHAAISAELPRLHINSFENRRMDAAFIIISCDNHIQLDADGGRQGFTMRCGDDVIKICYRFHGTHKHGVRVICVCMLALRTINILYNDI